MFTLLTGAQVYAPAPLGVCEVLVGAGRILAISAAGAQLPALPPGYGVERVDAAGCALVPGLVDAHVHLGGGGGESGYASRVPPIALGALALAGVTSVVGLLGTDTTTRTMEDLVARALGLRAEGISAWCYTGGYAVPPRTLTGSVRGDIVFVEPIVAVGELACSDHRSSQPTLDELLRIGADAHVAGLTSGKAGFVHLHLGDGARGLDLVRRALAQSELPARVWQPTHVNRNRRLFDEALALCVGHGVPIDITAFDAEPEGYDAPEAIARALATPGLPVARLTCSSDGAGCLPVFDADGQLTHMDVGRPATLLTTLAALRARGVALADALPLFTANPAAQLRLRGKGQVVVGGDADLVILRDGPGELGGARDVMAMGRWLVRDGVQQMFGPFEKALSAGGRA